MPPQRRIDVVLDSVKRLQRIGATANLLNLLQKAAPRRPRRSSSASFRSRDSALWRSTPLLDPRTVDSRWRRSASWGPTSARLAARPITAGRAACAASSRASLRRCRGPAGQLLPEELSQSVLELMRHKESGEVQNLLDYDDKTAGRMMNPNVFALAEDLTAGEAIEALQQSREVEMVFYLYLVDARRHLVGVVSLRRLLLVSPETPLKRIGTTDLVSARVDMDQEEVAELVASYNLLALPIVDEENKLVGIITVDDVIDVIKDEATEDIYRMAGVSSDEHVSTSAGEAWKKRLPWLGINLVTAILAAFVVRFVPGHDRRGRGPGRLHDDRGEHGWKRRDPDFDGRGPRHCPRRADLGQAPARC